MQHIQTIPLSRLAPCPANVRKTGRKTGIEGLAASIIAHGLLQNLQVRPSADESFEVVARGRRFDALKLLAKQKKIAPDYPVPCDVRDGSAATEISLAENEMREAMHPADQFEAFKKLADEGKGEEEIAARFGVTPQVVRQRLKLAVISPKLIAAYRKEDMTLDCLMAFTVSDDHKQQEKVWTSLPDYARERPGHIRNLLTESTFPPTASWRNSSASRVTPAQAVPCCATCSMTATHGSPIRPCSTNWRRRSWNKPLKPCAAKAGNGVGWKSLQPESHKIRK
jgi:ParB family chromosome partitioning protein